MGLPPLLLHPLFDNRVGLESCQTPHGCLQATPSVPVSLNALMGTLVAAACHPRVAAAAVLSGLVHIAVREAARFAAEPGFPDHAAQQVRRARGC